MFLLEIYNVVVYLNLHSLRYGNNFSVPVTARITFGDHPKKNFIFIFYFVEYDTFGSSKWDIWHKVYLFGRLF